MQLPFPIGKGIWSAVFHHTPDIGMGDAGRRYVIYLKAGSYTPTPAMRVKVVGNPVSYGIRAINDWNKPNPSFMKSYWSYREQVKSRSDSVISTVSLEHAIAGKDTDKNITATLNGQDITGICVEADARRLGRCNHPQRRQTYQGCGRGCYHQRCMAKSPLH